ncbi:MAG: hypothetical protein HC854_16860, partial [Flavobacterium sp.]|nr:hypothetical protein [Flavobacterium sp.]
MLFFLFFIQNIYSQTIKGIVTNIDNNFIDVGYVEFKEKNDPNTIKEYVLFQNGKFEYALTKKYDSLLVEVSATNFQTENKVIENLTIKEYNINFILIEDKVNELKEVIIVSEKKNFVVREDTLSFNVSKFQDGTERKIEDVIKKLPGISVNDKTGEIKYNGKSVETVTLDGDNMFGYNYSLGTKNISVDMIEQVQAINNYSENGLLKDIESGDKVSLNLKLKKGVTDFSGNIESGVGLNSDNELLNKTDFNLLQISKRYKSLGLLKFNNIGENNSSYDFFSGSQNVQQLKNRKNETFKVIPETLFSSFIDNDRLNNNNLLVTSYNNLFKINKRLSVKANFLFIRDNINYIQSNQSENLINGQEINISDFYDSNKKPKLYNGDIELKYNTSKSSLLEYKAKYIHENTTTNSKIIANNLLNFNSDIENNSNLFNQNLTFTKKINETNAFQIILNEGFNDIPQLFRLNSFSKINLQYSNSNKKYFDATLNILGKIKNIKYFSSLAYLTEKTLYKSDNDFNDSNKFINNVIYNKNTLIQFNSLSYNKNKWLISFSLALKHYNQQFENRVNDNVLNENNTVLEPVITLKYKINTISFVSIKANNFRNPIIEEFIFNNPVIISNRISIENSPNLSIQSSKSFNILYSNNNVYKKLLFEFGINYNVTRGNFYASYNIEQNNTRIINKYLDLNNENFNFNF